MAPHLLTLPVEIRYRILKYARRHDQTTLCTPTTTSNDRHLMPLHNPDTDLFLIRRQLSSEMSTRGVEKLELRFCSVGCAGQLFGAIANPWKQRVKCFRRYYDAQDLRKHCQTMHDFETWVKTLLGYADYITKYETKGDIDGPNGVDVTYYL